MCDGVSNLLCNLSVVFSVHESVIFCKCDVACVACIEDVVWIWWYLIEIVSNSDDDCGDDVDDGEKVDSSLECDWTISFLVLDLLINGWTKFTELCLVFCKPGMTVTRTELDFKSAAVPYFFSSDAITVCNFVPLSFTSRTEDCLLALVVVLVNNPTKGNYNQWAYFFQFVFKMLSAML